MTDAPRAQEALLAGGRGAAPGDARFVLCDAPPRKRWLPAARSAILALLAPVNNLRAGLVRRLTART
jgi:hypothetical protein